MQCFIKYCSRNTSRILRKIWNSDAHERAIKHPESWAKLDQVWLTINAKNLVQDRGFSVSNFGLNLAQDSWASIAEEITKTIALRSNVIEQCTKRVQDLLKNIEEEILSESGDSLLQDLVLWEVAKRNSNADWLAKLGSTSHPAQERPPLPTLESRDRKPNKLQPSWSKDVVNLTVRPLPCILGGYLKKWKWASAPPSFDGKN